MELDLAAMHKLVAEQGIDADTLDNALAEAFLQAYFKMPNAAKHARAEIDNRAGTLTIWARQEIPQEPTEDNPHPAPVLGEEYDDTPHDFGRLAVTTARQTIGRMFQQAEDNRIFGAFAGKKGQLVTGTIQQNTKDTKNVHIAIGDVEALLPREEQVPGETYRHGDKIRVYVVRVSRGVRGPEITVSRSHPELIRRLFERVVPELVSGEVAIMAIAREAGARTKVAVRANVPGVNPKGALIGPGGSRVHAVMNNIGDEKIDIVDWSDDPAKFVASALSPAHAVSVQVISEKSQIAIAYIHEDQLSLAIGKEGQNARLAAKLTGWRIGIESEEKRRAMVAAGQDPTLIARAANAARTGGAAPRGARGAGDHGSAHAAPRTPSTVKRSAPQSFRGTQSASDIELPQGTSSAARKPVPHKSAAHAATHHDGAAEPGEAKKALPKIDLPQPKGAKPED